MFDPDPDKPLGLLAACPAYERTALTEITDASGLTVLVKDESGRMGLGSFKALGGVYAVAMMIKEHYEAATGRTLVAEDLVSAAVREFSASKTFVCASAGNHGLAIAEGARLFGARARIYLSHQVPEHFEKRLLAKKAAVVRSGNTYEESMAAAKADAEQTNATLLADAAWRDYLAPPALVMEGYTVIAEELRETFEQLGAWPSDVYLQAGVGGLAAAITRMIRSNWRVQPRIVVVEPEAAACLAASSREGRPTRSDGPATNMGRLDCKEPSLIAHTILERSNVEFVSVSDDEADAAAAFLSSRGVPTTPSGAAGLAGLRRVRGTSDVDPTGLPLILVTEGEERAA